MHPGFLLLATWLDTVFLGMRFRLPRKAHSTSPVHFPEAIPIMLELWSEANIYEDRVSQDIEASLLSALAEEELWTGVSSYIVISQQCICSLTFNV